MIRFRRIGDDSWQRAGWRTDVPTNLYSQFGDIVAVRWQTPDGAACIVPISELRRVFADARPRGGDGNKFLFRLIPDQRGIRPDGQDDVIPVDMEVLDGPGPNGDDPPRRRRGWGIQESEWHRDTVFRIGHDPALVGIVSHRVVQKWVNSCRSNQNEWLWHVLRTYKRPDVVIELKGPREMIVIEVEPKLTLADGIAQLAGDYVVSLEVDRHLAGEQTTVHAILVSDTDPIDFQQGLAELAGARRLALARL